MVLYIRDQYPDDRLLLLVVGHRQPRFVRGLVVLGHGVDAVDVVAAGQRARVRVPRAAPAVVVAELLHVVPAAVARLAVAAALADRRGVLALEQQRGHQRVEHVMRVGHVRLRAQARA